MKKQAWMGIVMATAMGGSALAQQAAAPVPTWADKVTVKGDVRYRYEDIDDDTKSDTRQRDRIRARVGVDAKVNDTVKAGVSLATGSESSKTSKEEPNSSNQTLGEGFTGKDIFVDTAFIDWSLVVDKVNVIGGKMKNPFINVGDLIWDGDVTPEGLALNARLNGERAGVELNGGYLWMNEIAPSAKGKAKAQDDLMLYVGQLAGRVQIVDEVYLRLGGSLYRYDDLEGVALNDVDYAGGDASFGNSTANVVSGGSTNKVYKYNVETMEAFAELGVWVGIPITFVGQYAVNDAAEEFDTGYLYGVGIGKAKNPKTWELNYNYVKLEKDAVLGALTDSDRFGGGTDGKGHKIQAKYQIAKNLQLGATYFINERTISDDAKTSDYNRLQVDLVASF